VVVAPEAAEARAAAAAVTDPLPTPVVRNAAVGSPIVVTWAEHLIRTENPNCSLRSSIT
jgi:hypothetical protein